MALYHASPQKGLSVLVPQRTFSHDRYIGDFVFATANRVMALMYLVPRGTATLMNPDGKQPDIAICAEPGQFLQQDKGGAIYELAPDGFRTTPQPGLSRYELVSPKAVEPTSITVYASTLRALLDAGVTVRFIDESTFKLLIGNPKQAEVLHGLPAYSPS